MEWEVVIMAQTTNTDEASPTGENGASPSLGAEFSAWTTQAEQLAQEQVRKEIAEHLAAGRAIFFGGTGADAGKVFERRPDGKVFLIRVLEDGSFEEIHQVGE